MAVAVAVGQRSATDRVEKRETYRRAKQDQVDWMATDKLVLAEYGWQVKGGQPGRAQGRWEGGAGRFADGFALNVGEQAAVGRGGVAGAAGHHSPLAHQRGRGA